MEEDFGDLPHEAVKFLAAWTDLTALQSSEVQHLEVRLPKLAIRSAWGVPFQVEGTFGELPLYFKYDSGYVLLSVGGDSALAPLYRAEAEFRVAKDPYMRGDELEKALELLLPQLRRSPRVWRFRDAYKKDTHDAWGMTPDEAWRRIHEYPEYLADYISREQWREIQAERHPVWPSITVDDRVWPDPEPEFRILPG